MYKYVITFEGLKPNLTITPTETIDPVAFIEKMDLTLFDTSKIKATEPVVIHTRERNIF